MSAESDNQLAMFSGQLAPALALVIETLRWREGDASAKPGSAAVEAAYTQL